MGGKGGDTTTRAELPQELRPLYQTSAGRITQLQQDLPVQAFLPPYGQARAAPPVTGTAPTYGTSPAAGTTTTAPGGRQVISSGRYQGYYQGPNGVWFSPEGEGQGTGWVPPGYSPPAATTQAGGQAQAGGGGGGQVTTYPGIPTPYQSAARAPQFAQAQSLLGDIRRVAAQDVTGANLQRDPAFQQANRAFEASILPQVQNQAALSGLGRTTGLEQALAQAQAQYLLPVIQDTLAREERGIDRELAGLQFAQPQLTQLGQLEQDYRQGRLDRQTQEFLRQQALAEQALYQPFGLIAPSTIGQRATSSGKKGK